MDRRSALAGMGVMAAAPGFALNAQAQGEAPVPHWSAPVIDMHFHMRRDPKLNVAHQQGAGVTAACLLTRNGSEAEVRALAAANPRMFPCHMVGYDVTKPDAEQVLTAAVKAGAKGIGELKYHVEADGPEMRRIYALCAELNVPVLIHFQEVSQAAAAGGYNTGIKRFGAVLKAYPKTKFILHADAFWANVSADYHEDTPYPSGPIVRGGISDKLLSDFENVQGDMASNSGNNALSRDPEFTVDFLKRHQDKLHFGSDCNCEDGRGGGAAQNSPQVAARIRGKCVARETLRVLTAATTPEIFRKLTWTNAHRLMGVA
ncbi:MAG: amidohydrolase family protein [Alphaproteobacteria bacterium]|nr:amidohydrolase family protein [Alphaproteobacteria bacterium]